MPTKRKVFISYYYISLTFFQVCATPRSCSICITHQLAMPSSESLGSSSSIFESSRPLQGMTCIPRPSFWLGLQHFTISSDNMTLRRFAYLMMTVRVTATATTVRTVSPNEVTRNFLHRIVTLTYVTVILTWLIVTGTLRSVYILTI